MSETLPNHPLTDSFSRHNSLTATDADIYRGTDSIATAYSKTPYRGDRALSWGAIFAGAAAGAALWLILLMLGVGLGLSAVSPWQFEGVTATTLGVSTILWLTLSHLVAAGLGGYLAGRFRTDSISASKDEDYFRDTAHGFLSWAVATLVSAVLLTSVVGSIVGGGIQAGVAGSVAVGHAIVVGSENESESPNNTLSYFIDSLFRAGTTGGAADPSSAAATMESARIFINGIRVGELPDEDLRHIGQVVADRTGLSQRDAQERVANTFARLQTTLQETETTAREAADEARKASAYAALWAFISMLIGAFVASLAATLGGRQREA
ncbi:hypothetical protein [Thiocapsa imhoffii]|uniref:hypothetical protein n=1 Tax=Thiocapsa imhoffii TaxID=382777 RepID=UPI0019089B4B|nr:hypothetical protein [Thiocapsa imhoffii]